MMCLHLFNTGLLQLFEHAVLLRGCRKRQSELERLRLSPLLFCVLCAIFHVSSSLFLDKSPQVVLVFKLGTVVLEDQGSTLQS